ncbi:MAG: endonuclease III [Deltaproteobacteria bacterium]|nr:endonuclease III [Deltaproteobacteria bacterium]
MPKRKKLLTLIHVPKMSKKGQTKKPRQKKGPPEPLSKPPVPIDQVMAYFAKYYAKAQNDLKYENVFQLLMATILVAQCTDQRVNAVTKVLFKRFPSAFLLAEAEIGQIEECIKSISFHRHKAQYISKTAWDVAMRYDGIVPRELMTLLTLPGVGRKSAMMVICDGYEIPGIIVDSHVGRVSRRMGLSISQEPEGLEEDLMKLVPKKDWTSFSHQARHHGRFLCKARKPLCRVCGLLNCPSREILLVKKK